MHDRVTTGCDTLTGDYRAYQRHTGHHRTMGTGRDTSDAMTRAPARCVTIDLVIVPGPPLAVKPTQVRTEALPSTAEHSVTPLVPAVKLCGCPQLI